MGAICRWLCLFCLTTSAMAGVAPNIVLITLDTTRADRMGFLGSTRGLTPNLDALARQSAVFTHAYAQAPLTSVSHATILTGTYPQFHGVVDFPMVLASDLPYLPDILHSHRYRTAAFVGALVLDPKGGAPGFDRGFDTYDANFSPENFETKGRYQSLERRGDEVLAHALKWLKARPQGPFFLWIHLYDPHEPYDPPEPYKSRYAAEPYDGEIAYDDAVIGKLISELKSRALFDGALITVTADHGESLGAHGEDTHGVFVYDETIQVPLLIKLPRANSSPATRPTGSRSQPPSAGRIDSRVELVDVMPTLLEAVDVAVPPEVQGKSLMGLIHSIGGDVPEDWCDRPAYAEAMYASLAYGWSPLRSLRTGKYLYVQAPRRELYDVNADPHAAHNLAPDSEAVADTLGARLEAFREKTTSSRQAPKADLDPARAKQLAALGYVVSSGTASLAGSSEQGADPKDRIQAVTTIRRLESLMWEKRYEDAIPVLQQLAAEFPDMAPVPLKLAQCYLALRQYDNAVAALRKAIALNPDLSVAQIELGKTLMGIGQFNEAAAALEKFTARTPKQMEAEILLEIAYARANRVPETIAQCNKVLAVVPDHYPSTMILGQFLAKSGDKQAAIEKLNHAAALRPASPEPHRALADVYDQLGKKEDAAKEREQADQLAGAVH